MASDLHSDVARVKAALDTPTLKLLDRKSAVVAMPIFEQVFSENAKPVAVERFHTRVEALLDEMRAVGYEAPRGNGKSLSMQWVRDGWLYRDPGEGQETYQLTGDAKQAMDYVTRATRTQLNVSASRIETMRRVIAEAALTANPDVRERRHRLTEEIARLQAEVDRLDAGGELPDASEAELTEQFANVLRELDGLPSDFRRVEEAMREMHRGITKRFREENRPVGEVLDDYLEQASGLLVSTQEGRAFQGALELLRKPDWLSTLRQDLNTVLSHPWSGTLLSEEQRQLRTAVDVIRRGIDDVLSQRRRLTSILREHIENYDHVKNRELDGVLRGIDTEMRIWMKSARARDHVDVELIPPPLGITALKLRVFDPESERPPAPLRDVSASAPDALSLEEIRKKGGPSLAKLKDHILQNIQSGEATTAAELFNSLPKDLRRPVEVMGIFHLLEGMGATDTGGVREEVTAIRADGSTRTFLVDAVSLEKVTDALGGTDALPEGEKR